MTLRVAGSARSRPYLRVTEGIAIAKNGRKRGMLRVILVAAALTVLAPVAHDRNLDGSRNWFAINLIAVAKQLVAVTYLACGLIDLDVTCCCSAVLVVTSVSPGRLA